MMRDDSAHPKPAEMSHGNQTTTTTTTAGPKVVALDWIKLDVNYFRTVPGILKLAEFVSSTPTPNVMYTLVYT